MKCVVTGAAGHIGNALVRELINKNYTVKALLLNQEDKENLKGLNLEFLYGDVTDIYSLNKAFEGEDVVFHLAGIIEIGNGNRKKLRQVNIEGTKNVYKACINANVKKLVYTSSVHAIPEKPQGQIIHETQNFSENFVKGAYAKTKAEATKFLLEKSKEQKDLEIIIVHPSGVIGPYEYEISNLGQLIIDCSNKKIGAYLKGGYNFVDVRDVANGIVLACKKGKAGQCYILDGHYISIKDLMKMVEKITGVKAPTFKIARWFAYITGMLSELYYKIVKQKPLFTSYAVYTLGTNSNFSHEKAQKELGYNTRDLEDTIKDTIKWFEDRGEIKIKK